MEDDTNSNSRNRRNTMGVLPALRSVLGDVLEATSQHSEWPRRSSWHGRLPTAAEAHVEPAPGPTTQYGYQDAHPRHYNDMHDRRPYPPTEHYSPSFDNSLRLPPLLYSPSSSIPESPLERSPGPYPPSSRENSPDAGIGEPQLQQSTMRFTLKRRKRSSQAVTVVPCMIEPPESRSPHAFNGQEIHDDCVPSPKESYRTVKIEVSGTREGKLIYELDIPESLIKHDAPMPASPYDPHPCILCGHIFVSERHMNRHLLTHTDIKPYQCNLCGKAFARPDSMIRHKRNVHGSSADSPVTPLAQFMEQSPSSAHLAIPPVHLLHSPHSPISPNSPHSPTLGLGLDLVYE